MMDPDERVYDIDEARALLPEIRATLLALAVERRAYAEAHAALHAADDAGHDAESTTVRAREAEASGRRARIRALLDLLEARGVQVRDLDNGLVDIPTLRDGRRAWLCWRLADPELSFWHTTREGFTSRRPL
jgi:hypothetical protein